MHVCDLFVDLTPKHITHIRSRSLSMLVLRPIAHNQALEGCVGALTCSQSPSATLADTDTGKGKGTEVDLDSDKHVHTHTHLHLQVAIHDDGNGKRQDEEEHDEDKWHINDEEACRVYVI